MMSPRLFHPTPVPRIDEAGLNGIAQTPRIRLCVRRVLNVTREVVGTENDNAFAGLRISVKIGPPRTWTQLQHAFIDAAIQAGEPCLVHCRQGASRLQR